MSANAPAGKVRRKKGSDAAVDKSESNQVEADSVCMTQVAAISAAATQHPETMLAIHSVRNLRLRSAVQIEVVLICARLILT
jgi:sulfur relay (sulfurtransferase) DsrF/TusC family protein